MNPAIPLAAVRDADRHLVGGKCHALSVLLRNGITVPQTVCVPTGAYERYLTAGGLRERIQLELNRRDLDDMRWEEIWDASLRIRQLFIATPVPPELEDAIWAVIDDTIGDGPCAVRSSAPGEDSASRSFAGLYESFLNVHGRRAVMEHLRLVWASLWTDASLLYRREQGLDIGQSAMAVAVQEFVEGGRSGVAFSVSPADETVLAIEAVHGLNEGLVDGTVEPDRWSFDRSSGALLEHRAGERRGQTLAAAAGTALAALPEGVAGRPPLSDGEAKSVASLVQRIEKIFGAPQDVEWTIAGGETRILQSRPITTLAGSADDGSVDERGWYLSLRRSLDGLRELREKIEEELVPEMTDAAAGLASLEPGLEDHELAAETERRVATVRHWEGMYREYFIPFAHGMRLFGRVYNQAVSPQDPYEFFELLPGEDLESLRRNEALAAMADRLRSAPPLADAVRTGSAEGLDEEFLRQRSSFVAAYGDLSCRSTGGVACGDVRVLDALLLEMASHPPAPVASRRRDPEGLRRRFLERFEPERLREAEEILEIARASYRLRDNDNIYLGRIQSAALLAANECVRRLRERGFDVPEKITPSAAAGALVDPATLKGLEENETDRSSGGVDEDNWAPRQIVGQPAGPGLARGRARVIAEHADLALFSKDEVLVCDAVDPNMTFVVPLAAAVVERRGGMLIHGAIIAREYGLPCVTGVAGATSIIRTGDEISVDGFLGIVTVARD